MVGGGYGDVSIKTDGLNLVLLLLQIVDGLESSCGDAYLDSIKSIRKHISLNR